jgi:hypothetical protein
MPKKQDLGSSKSINQLIDALAEESEKDDSFKLN